MYSTLWPQHFAADANLPAKAEGFAVTALLHLADLQRMLDEDLMEHAMPLSRVEGMSFDQAFLSNQAFLSHKAVLDPQVQADHGDAVSMAGMRALLRCVHTQCASLGRRLLACDRQMVVHATTDGLVLAVQGKAHAATAIVSTVAVAALFHRGQTFAALVRHTVMADDMLRAGLEEAAVYLLHGGWQADACVTVQPAAHYGSLGTHDAFLVLVCPCPNAKGSSIGDALRSPWTLATDSGSLLFTRPDEAHTLYYRGDATRGAVYMAPPHAGVVYVGGVPIVRCGRLAAMGIGVEWASFAVTGAVDGVPDIAHRADSVALALAEVLLSHDVATPQSRRLCALLVAAAQSHSGARVFADDQHWMALLESAATHDLASGVQAWVLEDVLAAGALGSAVTAIAPPGSNLVSVPFPTPAQAARAQQCVQSYLFGRPVARPKHPFAQGCRDFIRAAAVESTLPRPHRTQDLIEFRDTGTVRVGMAVLGGTHIAPRLILPTGDLRDLGDTHALLLTAIDALVGSEHWRLARRALQRAFCDIITCNVPGRLALPSGPALPRGAQAGEAGPAHSSGRATVPGAALLAALRAAPPACARAVASGRLTTHMRLTHGVEVWTDGAALDSLLDAGLQRRLLSAQAAVDSAHQRLAERLSFNCHWRWFADPATPRPPLAFFDQGTGCVYYNAQVVCDVHDDDERAQRLRVAAAHQFAHTVCAVHDDAFLALFQELLVAVHG